MSHRRCGRSHHLQQLAIAAATLRASSSLPGKLCPLLLPSICPLRSLYGFARRHFQCPRHSDLTPKRTTDFLANGHARNATNSRLEFITLAARVHSETSIQPTVVRWRMKLDDPHGRSRSRFSNIVPPNGAGCDPGHKILSEAASSSSIRITGPRWSQFAALRSGVSKLAAPPAATKARRGQAASRKLGRLRRHARGRDGPRHTHR